MSREPSMCCLRDVTGAARSYIASNPCASRWSPSLLNDRPFASQDQENFDSVFPPKVDAFTTSTRPVEGASLDFRVTFSSISAMFGNAVCTFLYMRVADALGRANTTLSGAIREYLNTFSIVPPIILDSSILTLTDDSSISRVRHMIQGVWRLEVSSCLTS